MNERNDPSLLERTQAGVNWFYAVARCFAITAEVTLLRYRFGPRYLGLHAFLAVPAALLYMLFWAGQDPRPLLAYLGLYMVMCLVARLRGLSGRARAYRGHSRYDGVPRLAVLFPRLSELAVKRVVEPIAVLLLSLPAMRFNEPLGVYLLLSALALFGCIHTNLAFEEVRAMDLHDALIDQQQVAARLRGLRTPTPFNFERNPS